MFITVSGACVGSFLNVVIYRLPHGRSLVYPSSHCPKCGTTLQWFDNVPVIAWFYLGGQCRRCKAAISFQYPLIEAVTATLFGGLFYVYYMTGFRPEFGDVGFGQTWPAFLVQLTLIGGLIAATAIDARLYIICLEIPWLTTLVAMLVLPVGVWQLPGMKDVCPEVNRAGVGVALGGAIALVMAIGLLRIGWLPYSFPEEQNDNGQPQEQALPSTQSLLAHPHPRREVTKELPFVFLPLIGALIGVWVSLNYNQAQTPLPPWVLVLSGTICGYLTGAGMIWFTRILGTWAFGREAMGLGDVHLLAAIGAVVGPWNTILVFFVAPFIGLLGTILVVGVSRMFRGEVRVIPYGPYLAAAAVAIMMCRRPLLEFLTIYGLAG